MEPEPRLNMNELAEAMLVPDLPPQPAAPEPSKDKDAELSKGRLARKPLKPVQPTD
jgi:hypothetical protein